MGLRFHIPLPGPFSFSVPLTGRRRRRSAPKSRAQIAADRRRHEAELAQSREEFRQARQDFGETVQRGRDLKSEYGYGAFDKVAPLVCVLLVLASFAFPPALIVTFPLAVFFLVRLVVKVRRYRRRRGEPARQDGETP